MSWVEIDDVAHGRVVVELQPTVLEIFTSRDGGTTRIHMRMLVIDALGPNAQGNHQVRLGNGTSSTTLTVPEQWWMRLWPLLEQARAAQYPYMGY